MYTLTLSTPSQLASISLLSDWYVFERKRETEKKEEEGKEEGRQGECMFVDSNSDR